VFYNQTQSTVALRFVNVKKKMSIILSKSRLAAPFSSRRVRLALPQYVRQAPKSQMTPGVSALSPSERLAAWRMSTAGLPIRPPLADRATSRAGVYDARG
jgi:hypothetical protein